MKNIRNSIIYCFIVTTIIIALFSVLKYTANAADINIENGVSGVAIQKTIIKPYTFKSSSYTPITVFPIDAVVFNSDADFFCAQHGTSYGRTDRRTTLAPEFHTSHVITKHKVAQGYNTIYFNNRYNYYSSNPKGDVDTTANIYLDTSGNYVLRNNATYRSYREYTETGAATVYTNWVYNLQTITFDCETAYSSNEITDGGMAFLLACYKQTNAERASTGYNNDPLQFAVWDWLGQLGSKPNPLKEAALSYQQYHEMSKEPNVDTVPDSNVGTTTNSSMTSYSVGPFKMSNYIRAEDFIYDEQGSYHAVIYDTTIENNISTDIYNMDINNTGVDLQSTFDKYSSGYDGTIIKAEAVVTNE